jgi:DNA-binding SARP family transcriptional activator
VLAEKTLRPTAAGLSRTRLETPLLAVDGPRLTVVSAPAGSGKSTLLAQIAARSEARVAWYRLTADDGDPDTLVGNLGALLSDVPLVDRETPPNTAAGLPRAGDVEELVAALRRMTEPVVLFLDDLHEIAGTRAERAVEIIVSAQPRAVRFVLASRRMPDFDLSSLRTAGAIHEINSDDLRFRVWEVEELFTVVYGEPLCPETAAALTRRTGGWAAGLQLFHLANARKTRSARQQAVTALGPRARLIRTYLARNVLDGLPEQRRQFLVRTSALGLLSAPLCDALLGATDSAEVLEELERDQLFTTSVDDGLTYRYHEVLQRHLQMMLTQELGPLRTRQWYARCARLLDDAGAHGDALRAYAIAEDWVPLVHLVRRRSAETTTAIAIEPERLLPPSLIKDDPWLALADARRRLRHGSVAAAVAGLAHAQTLLDEPRFRRTCELELDAIRVWIPGTSDLPDSPNPATAWSAQIRAATRHGRPAARHATRLATAYPMGREALVRGIESLISGEFGSARAYFADATAAIPDVSLPRLAALLGGVIADAAEARASDYAARLEEITLDAEASGYPWVSRLARGLLTAILAVSDAAPWRLDAFSELLVECDRAGDAWGAALLQLASAVAAALVGHAAVPARFADAEQRFLALDAGAVASWVQLLAARYATGGRQAEVTVAPARPAAQVRCFGGFRIEVDGEPVDLHELRPRALAVLRLLAYEHGADVHRERLIDSLWPDATLDAGTRRLQVAVSSIRQVLQRAGVAELDGVRRTADSYRLTLTDATVDIAEFERLLAAAGHERQCTSRRIELRTRALGLYTGDLFPEEGTAEHIVSERERLRLAAAEAAGNLAQDHATAGDLAEAVAVARRSLELDRYRDSAWRLLADCLSARGDETAATHARLQHSRVRAALEVAEVPDNPIGDVGSLLSAR